MKAILDQGVPYSTARELNQAGWDVIHTVDRHMERATDRQIIAYARSEERVCITLDADFHSIIALNDEVSPSVIRIRQEGLKGPDLAGLLLRVASDVSEQLYAGALITVTDKSIRVRRLPVLGC